MADLSVIWEHSASVRCGWFRFLGVGVCWIDTEQYGPLRAVIFTDKKHARWKDRRQLRIGAWRFALTTRRNP